MISSNARRASGWYYIGKSSITVKVINIITQEEHILYLYGYIGSYKMNIERAKSDDSNLTFNVESS